MKTRIMLAAICILAAPALLQAQDTSHRLHGDMMHGDGMQSGSMHPMQANTGDERISLGLAPMQKQHQLANMRSHLKAVQDIVGMISEKRFDEASAVAHEKLGLTPEMQKMCSMFSNANFRELGLAFHRSADELGDTLKKGDLKQSMQALNRTMNYCIRCHATYRQ